MKKISRKGLDWCYKLFSWRLNWEGQFSFISFPRIWKSAPFPSALLEDELHGPKHSEERLRNLLELRRSKMQGDFGGHGEERSERKCLLMFIGNRLSVTDRQLLAQINIFHQLLDTSFACPIVVFLCSALCIFILSNIKGIA